MIYLHYYNYTLLSNVIQQVDYICRRHSKVVRCFHDDKDVRGMIVTSMSLFAIRASVYQLIIIVTRALCKVDHLRTQPASTLIDALVSYDIYAYTARFSKRFAGTASPLSYVVVT